MSSISSGLSELQDQMLRGVGLDLDKMLGGVGGGDGEQINKEAAAGRECKRLSAACNEFLVTLVEDSVSCIEQACSSVSETRDWIMFAMEREDFNDTGGLPGDKDKDDKASGNGSSMTSSSSRPSVLFAYFVLRSILASRGVAFQSTPPAVAAAPSAPSASPSAQGSSHIRKSVALDYDFNPGSPLHIDTSVGGTDSAGGHKSGTGNNGLGMGSEERSSDPMTCLVSSATLSKLLKASLSANISLQFCSFDLSALILSRVNIKLYDATNARLFSRKRRAMDRDFGLFPSGQCIRFFRFSVDYKSDLSDIYHTGLNYILSLNECVFLSRSWIWIELL